MRSFQKISDNQSLHASLVLKGLGTFNNPHTDLVTFLVSQWLEVYYFDRYGDQLLSENPLAINQYLEWIGQAVNMLLDQWKLVHLLGISFGGYLSLKLAEDTKVMVDSVVAIAPLLDPYKTISSIGKLGKKEWMLRVRLANGLNLEVLQENITAIKDQSHKIIIQPWLILLGDKDGFTETTDLNRITGAHLYKHILPNVRHGETTGHTQTRVLLNEFYKRIIT